jgi:uncharacterized protein (DUF1697 family)
MNTLVSMIRGINVGGNRPIKMERLREIYAELGLGSIRTHLQSGNVVFESENPDADAHGEAIEQALRLKCRLEVDVGVRTARSFTAAFRANPLAGRPGTDLRFLHATFLIRPGVRPSLKGVELPLGPGEAAVMAGTVVYLYCPNGYGSTKINNTLFERRLSARATTRNWQTVTALERMARGLPPP